MKRPWKRPAGCQCDERLPAKHKCTAEWMRCHGRLAYEYRVHGVPIRVKPAKLPKRARKATDTP